MPNGVTDVRTAAARQSRAARPVGCAAEQSVQLALDLGDAPEETVVSGLPEMTGAERVRAELEVLGLDVSRHVVDFYTPLLRALGTTRSPDLVHQRSRRELLVAGVKVATQTPPIRSGRRVVFLTLDDSSGPLDATFFEDVQGPYAATVFGSWLLVVRGVLRRTGPRGVSLRATGAWDLTALWDAWTAGGLAAVHAEMAWADGFDERAVAGAAASRSTRPVMVPPPQNRTLGTSRDEGAVPWLPRRGWSRTTTRGPAAWVGAHGTVGCWCTPAGSGSRPMPTSSHRGTTSATPAGRRRARRRGSCGTPAPGARADEQTITTLDVVAPPSAAPTAGSARRRPPASVLAAGVDRLLASCRSADGPVHVLDLGGGTGGQAVRLAEAGHRVTVVDPSPDALAALARRASEAGVADAVHAVQGDAENLADLAGDASVDLVLCHGVLEVVDDPAAALRTVHRVLRPTGRLSLLVTQRNAAVLARVSHGQLRQATHLALDPDGRWGDDDPLRRRFDPAQARDLLADAGFTVVEAEGIRVFADLVPRGHGAEDSDQAALLAGLEAHAAGSDAYRGIAAQLHLHAMPA